MDYVLHPLRLSQSPLEGLFSQLRGMDATSPISSANIGDRLAAVLCGKNLRVRDGGSYDNADILNRGKIRTTYRGSTGDDGGV